MGQALSTEKRGHRDALRTGKRNPGSAEVDLAKGEPENPATWEEIYEKFLTNAVLLISREDAERLGTVISHLEESSLDDVTGLI